MNDQDKLTVVFGIVVLILLFIGMLAMIAGNITTEFLAQLGLQQSAGTIGAAVALFAFVWILLQLLKVAKTA